MYPAGFNNGYIMYLDVDKRNIYWDGYARLFWDLRKEMREIYGTFDNYYQKFFAEIRKVREQAKSKLNPLTKTDDSNLML